jgi:hypothetical protein
MRKSIEAEKKGTTYGRGKRLEINNAQKAKQNTNGCKACGGTDHSRKTSFRCLLGKNYNPEQIEKDCLRQEKVASAIPPLPSEPEPAAPNNCSENTPADQQDKNQHRQQNQVSSAINTPSTPVLLLTLANGKTHVELQIAATQQSVNEEEQEQQ